QVLRETVEARHRLHRLQSGELALGELARCGYAAVAHLFHADFSLEVLPRLAVADAAHRGQVGPQRIAFPERAQLLHQSSLEHRVEAFFDPPVQLTAVRRLERDFDWAEG